MGFDPRTSADARCIMVWGANPSATAPHADRYWLGEFKGPKIVVDPIRHATAAAADLHLQLFPGTDGALAFAMIHAIRAGWSRSTANSSMPIPPASISSKRSSMRARRNGAKR